MPDPCYLTSNRAGDALVLERVPRLEVCIRCRRRRVTPCLPIRPESGPSVRNDLDTCCLLHDAFRHLRVSNCCILYHFEWPSRCATLPQCSSCYVQWEKRIHLPLLAWPIGFRVRPGHLHFLVEEYDSFSRHCPCNVHPYHGASNFRVAASGDTNAACLVLQSCRRRAESSMDASSITSAKSCCASDRKIDAGQA